MKKEKEMTFETMVLPVNKTAVTSEKGGLPFHCFVCKKVKSKKNLQKRPTTKCEGKHSTEK